MPFYKSLQFKFVFPIVLILVVALLTVGGLSLLKAKQALEEEASTRNQIILEHLGNSLEQRLHFIRERVIALGSSGIVSRAFDMYFINGFVPFSAFRELQKLRQKSHLIEDILLLTGGGIVIADTPL